MPNTIGVARPPSGAPPAALVDHTAYIPARPPTPSRQPGRPLVRVTVVQCDDARVVNQSFDVGESFEIGRETGDLRANDVSWSRRHAVIEYVNDGYAIRDLGSTIGTYVNGRRVRPNASEPLLFGARITIGGSVLVFSPISETRLPDLTGAVVDNRYVLKRLLRSSSKGCRVRGSPADDALRHALKLLSPALLDYPGYRDRFKREAEVAIELHHPHICEVQDYGETTITLSRATRRQHGVPLSEADDWRHACRSARCPSTDFPTRRPAMDRQPGGALAYAHERNTVHGDIKPAAVVFDDGGNAYLTDFAIGQPREGDSTPGVIGIRPTWLLSNGRVSRRPAQRISLDSPRWPTTWSPEFVRSKGRTTRRSADATSSMVPCRRIRKLAAMLGRGPPAVSDVLAQGLAFSADDRAPTSPNSLANLARRATRDA